MSEKLLDILGDLQKASNYLTEDQLIQVATELDLPLSKVYGVATFYSLYSTKPRGKYVIRVCENAPCHVEGAQAVIDTFRAVLGVDYQQTTEDGMFTLEATSCLGICGVAPAVMINSTVHGNLTPQLVNELIDTYRAKQRGA